MAPVKNKLRLPSGFFLTDETRTPNVLAAIENLPPGVGVIFRHYRAPDREGLAEQAARVCKDQKRIFLIGADGCLALKVGASGLHLPRWAKAAGFAVAPRDRRWLVTASAHSVAGLRRARDFGADAVLLSPVFVTLSRPGDRPLGIHGFARMCRMIDVPVFALGGITEENFRRLPPIANLAGPAGITLYK